MTDKRTNVQIVVAALDAEDIGATEADSLAFWGDEARRVVAALINAGRLIQDGEE